MKLKEITEEKLLKNLIRKPLDPSEQIDIADRYYKSALGTHTIIDENHEFKTVPFYIYWAYVWRYGSDDSRTATICRREDANCIAIDDIDKIYFIDF